MTESFIDQFEAPTLEELMNLYVYRSGAAFYDQVLRDEMESLDLSAVEVDYTRAIQKVENAIANGETSYEVTVVIPIDIETSIDVKINYVFDVNHKININVDQCVAFEYEQEVSVEVNPPTECFDPITGFTKWAYVPGDGDTYKMALHDTGAIDSYVSEYGERPTVDQLTEFTGEAPAISLNEVTGRGRADFDFGALDVLDVREGNAYGGLTATLFGTDGVLDGYQHRILPPTLDAALDNVVIAELSPV